LLDSLLQEMSTQKCSTRIVLLACGSFNPPTILHLRMFELAKDYFRQNRPDMVVIGGIISPTHDSYKKKSLIGASHRLEMTRRATCQIDWVNTSDWETRQSEWTRTRRVLDEYSNLIKSSGEGKSFDWLPNTGSENQGPIAVKLLCGGDLLESFSVPGLWKDEDIEAILKNHGIVVITRENSDPVKYVESSTILSQYKDNIHIVPNWVSNNVSSTKIRDAVQRGDSIRFLVPDAVVEYIKEHNLYKNTS